MCGLFQTLQHFPRTRRCPVSFGFGQVVVEKFSTEDETNSARCERTLMRGVSVHDGVLVRGRLLVDDVLPHLGPASLHRLALLHLGRSELLSQLLSRLVALLGTRTGSVRSGNTGCVTHIPISIGKITQLQKFPHALSENVAAASDQLSKANW